MFSEVLYQRSRVTSKSNGEDTDAISFYWKEANLCHANGIFLQIGSLFKDAADQGHCIARNTLAVHLNIEWKAHKLSRNLSIFKEPYGSILSILPYY